MRNRRLVQLDVRKGCTTVAGIVATTALLSVALVALFCYVFFLTGTAEDPQQATPLRWLIIGFTASALFMAAMALHRWSWDEDGLEFKGLLRTISLPWSDLTRAGLSWHGAWFAADYHGRKIYWSLEYTIGGDVITAAVAHYRPDLIAPS